MTMPADDATVTLLLYYYLTALLLYYRQLECLYTRGLYGPRQPE